MRFSFLYSLRIIQSSIALFSKNISTLNQRSRMDDASFIDTLFNIAGMWAKETLEEMNEETILKQFQVNALGPLLLTTALQHQFIRGSKVVLMTSRMGSIGNNTSGGRYGYRMSKAALNAAGKSLALDLAEQGIAVGIYHPGLVATDMTDYKGVSTENSVNNLLERVEELSLKNSGKFFHVKGEVLPW